MREYFIKVMDLQGREQGKYALLNDVQAASCEKQMAENRVRNGLKIVSFWLHK